MYQSANSKSYKASFRNLSLSFCHFFVDAFCLEDFFRYCDTFLRNTICFLVSICSAWCVKSAKSVLNYFFRVFLEISLNLSSLQRILFVVYLIVMIRFCLWSKIFALILGVKLDLPLMILIFVLISNRMNAVNCTHWCMLEHIFVWQH